MLDKKRRIRNFDKACKTLKYKKNFLVLIILLDLNKKEKTPRFIMP